MPGRGIETFIKLLSKNKDIYGVIMGSGQQNYVEELKGQADEGGVADRLLFYPAVKQDELWKYAGAADAGMILASATTKNALFSLPNKFFENIQSGTPIICPFYPEMKRIVDEYKVGLTCDPEDIEDINACIERLRTDRELYAEIKGNIKAAQKELSWDREKKKLYDSYRALIA